MIDKERILVVEDEVGVALALSRALSSPQCGNYRVESCSSGEAALERLQAARFDLLISDLHLPSMSGLELIERVHEISPGTRSVLITTFVSLEVKKQTYHLADAFLPKPFGLHDMTQVVKSLLGKSTAYEGSEQLGVKDKEKDKELVADTVTVR